MSPAARKPPSEGVARTQKIVLHVVPPSLAVFGLVRLLTTGLSGSQVVESVLLVVLGAGLTVSNVRDLVRRKGREMSTEPLFEITMRGYRRRDVDQYIAALQAGRGGEVAVPVSRPGFAVVWRGYHRRQVNDYLAALEGGRPHAS
ncbi:hypothetical protein [Nonomuraea sp. NPDC048826]|uniref:hypothetical protein n=1 Tax=Nonomuraea sp. NPDC048826 TaxID=3364347 RepID=UPI0037147143